MDLGRVWSILRPDWNRRFNCADDADGAGALNRTALRNTHQKDELVDATHKTVSTAEAWRWHDP